MFAIKQNVEGKWVITWGGVETHHEPLLTRNLAENRLARLQNRYPGTTYGLLKTRTQRGGPYKYSWDDQWHDYLPEGIKSSGLIHETSRTKAKDYMRYRLEKRGVSQEKIRSLLTALDLEAVRG
jgi:hypothetical protein